MLPGDIQLGSDGSLVGADEQKISEAGNRRLLVPDHGTGLVEIESHFDDGWGGGFLLGFRGHNKIISQGVGHR